jgi:ABC-type antimicrobial peptide transport system permease subunit
VRYKGLHEMPLDLYDPPSQSTAGTVTSVVVRLKPEYEGQALAVAAAVQAQARQRDPRALVSQIGMLEDVVNKEIAPWRFSAWVFALFAGLAFALAVLGLFSLVTLDVANRRHEFAIRMAVGAEPKHVIATVFRSAGVRAGIGVAIGLLTAAVVTRSLQQLLFGVTLGDAMTYGSVMALVFIVVAVASYVPARRAGASDPLSLLRRG